MLLPLGLQWAGVAVGESKAPEGFGRGSLRFIWVGNGGRWCFRSGWGRWAFLRGNWCGERVVLGAAFKIDGAGRQLGLMGRSRGERGGSGRGWGAGEWEEKVWEPRVPFTTT